MSVATSIYAAAVGNPIPKIREEAIVRTKAIIRLFPDIEIMNELNFRPIPVKVTTPIIIPAVAVAKATGIIASEAETAASTNCEGFIRLDFLSKESPSTHTIPASDEYITE